MPVIGDRLSFLLDRLPSVLTGGVSPLALYRNKSQTAALMSFYLFLCIWFLPATIDHFWDSSTWGFRTPMYICLGIMAALVLALRLLSWWLHRAFDHNEGLLKQQQLQEGEDGVHSASSRFSRDVEKEEEEDGDEEEEEVVVQLQHVINPLHSRRTSYGSMGHRHSPPSAPVVVGVPKWIVPQCCQDFVQVTGANENTFIFSPNSQLSSVGIVSTPFPLVDSADFRVQVVFENLNPANCIAFLGAVVLSPNEGNGADLSGPQLMAPGIRSGFSFSSRCRLYHRGAGPSGVEFTCPMLDGSVVGFSMLPSSQTLTFFHDSNSDMVPMEMILPPGVETQEGAMVQLRIIVDFFTTNSVWETSTPVKATVDVEKVHSSPHGLSEVQSSPANVPGLEMETEDIEPDHPNPESGYEETSSPKGELFTYIDEFGEVQTYRIFESEQDYETSAALERESSLEDPQNFFSHIERVRRMLHARGHTQFTDEEFLSHENAVRQLPPRGLQLQVESDLEVLRETRLSCGGCCSVTIPFRRIDLESILDRDKTWGHFVVAVLLSLGVVVLSWEIRPLLRGMSVIALWYLTGTVQFALLKAPTVEPNTTSLDSREGSFYRAFHFLWMSGLVVIMRGLEDSQERWMFYSLSFVGGNVAFAVRSVIVNLLLFLPLLLAVGLLPQIRTFVMFVLEQSCMMLFGSNGTFSLWAAMVEVVKGCFCWILLVLVGSKSFSARFASGKELGSQLGFLSLAVFFAWMLSRTPSNPMYLVSMFRTCKDSSSGGSGQGLSIELPERPRRRLFWDFVVGLSLFAGTVFLTGVGVFHSAASNSTPVRWNGVAVSTGPTFFTCAVLSILLGFTLFYLIPQLQKTYPFLLFKGPFLRGMPRQLHFNESDSNAPSKHVTRLSRALVVLRYVAQAMLIFTLLLGAVQSIPQGVDRFGERAALIILSVALLKVLRSVLGDQTNHWAVMLLVLLIELYDYRRWSETFLVDYALGIIVVHKARIFFQRTVGILSFTNPFSGSITGCAQVFFPVMAVAQYSLFIFILCLSVAFEFTLYPLMGSGAFLLGYPRPFRFWERNYQTSKLGQSQDEESPVERYSLSNKNAVVYEHLLGQIRRSMGTFVKEGTLGCIRPGDVFLYLFDERCAFLHVVEVGNGFCTLQLRGLEFAGTACHELERSRISSSAESALRTDRVKCLSLKRMLKLRVQSWQIISSELNFNTYSVALLAPHGLLPTFEERSNMIFVLTSAILWNVSRHPKFPSWLSLAMGLSTSVDSDRPDFSISTPCQELSEAYVANSPLLDHRWNLDADPTLGGVTLSTFLERYGPVIDPCVNSLKDRLVQFATRQELPPFRDEDLDGSSVKSVVVKFLFLVSIFFRKRIAAPHERADPHAPPSCGPTVELADFLAALYDVFVGDFSQNLSGESSDPESWILQCSEIKACISDGFRYGLRLFQDQASSSWDYVADPDSIFSALQDDYSTACNIFPETDPRWNATVLNTAEELFTFRVKMNDMGESEIYQFIKLTTSKCPFVVARLNPEIVRGLWASTIHEVMFAGNSENERGSLQSMPAALRNLTTTSVDLPFGYPIYVSPLVTAFW